MKTSIELLADLLAKLALELNFVEPGKDAGLLPINSFVAEIEDALRGQPAPTEISQAVRLARQWIDKLFDTTATFDAPTIARLGEWQAWMSSAVKNWGHQQPCPALPPAWSSASAGTMTEQESPGAASSPPSAPAPSAAEPFFDTEPVLTLALEADQELLREFINESQEHLQNIENGVLVLEENPGDADTLNSIFRAFHTFKGGSGFLNLTPIKNLAHELESLLDAARQQKLVINSAIIDVILQGGDTLKTFTAEIDAQLKGTNPGQPIVVATLQLIARVKAALANPGATVPSLSAAPTSSAPALSQVTDMVENAPAASAACRPAEAVKTAPAPTGNNTGLKPGANEKAEAALAPASDGAPASPPPAADKPRTNPAPAATGAAGFVKVDTAKLDSLIDLVGELVISESMVVQDPELLRSPSRNLARNLSQLRRITSELQRTAMSLRMVPIRSTFQKMTRLLRDLAAKQGKQIQLVLSGEDTELDRNIVEEISDPLVHMIRNAADHGVDG